MPSLWFVMPARGRAKLARICMRQLRRTCDALTEHGIDTTAVVIADDENLDTARELGFATVERDNRFLSRKFNDGIQAACDDRLPERGGPGVEVSDSHGRYRVSGDRKYRGHDPGVEFEAKLEHRAERRALLRGDIRLLERVAPTLEPGSYDLTDHPRADYVVPIGSDDWVDWQLFTSLPSPLTVTGFQLISFVREDGRELTARYLRYEGGCGIRIYPRHLLGEVGYRPADEDRKRACDTSILVNLRGVHGGRMRVRHQASDARQIVDWKSDGEQLNSYADLGVHRGQALGDPFDELDGFFPTDALEEMRSHYRPLVAA